MKKLWAIVLCALTAAALFADGAKDQNAGELVVYGSCEEAYVAAVCAKFEALTGVRTTYQRLSTGEVFTKIEEENGKPSADVWFGGTTDPYNMAANKGLLYPYKAENAKHLIGPQYKDKNDNWHGIYRGILGFFWNTEEMRRLGLQPPKDWNDLLKPEYKGLISFANPNTAGPGKLIINTIGPKPKRERLKLPNTIQKIKSSTASATKLF